MKKILIVIIIVLIAGAAGLFLFKNNSKEQKFRTAKILKGDIQEAVTATGTVNAVTTVLVGTQVSGTIKHIYIDFNSPVKKGQLIAEIDPSVFEAQAEQSRANLLSAKANLDKAEAALTDAKRTFDRNKELFSRNLIARGEKDTAETNYETAKAQIGVVKAQIVQAEAALKIAETNLGYTKIVSPVDGTVVSRNVDAGQTVAASFQTPTLFTIAQDLTRMQIDTSVDEADIGKIRNGQGAEFTVDAYPETTFKGRVFQVRNAPVTVQNVVTYDAVIMVSNPELKLKPGMTANVSIITAQKKDVVKIPNAALRFKLTENGKAKDTGRREEKGPGVYTLEKGNAKRVKVATGISDGNYTELKAGGIGEGQEVIVESIAVKNQKQAEQRPRFF
ncbi:MAG: efflux RND transporter periplasmic adaptor subunit [Nitrospirae bacterium]|nr:efflux RND transporter periplasmic adaptor subunit [Nitrospirota bacterium]